MAEQTVSEREDVSSKLMKARDIADDVLSLNALVQWVTEAKGTLDELRDICRLDESAGALMQRYDVRINSPEWCAEHDNGLAQVFALARRKLVTVKEGEA